MDRSPSLERSPPPIRFANRVDNSFVKSLAGDTSTARAEGARLQYVSIPDFDEWRDLSIDNGLWQRRVTELDSLRAEVPADALRSATERILRSAAVDTGALEGLYPTDRNVTRTVAIEAPGWQHVLEQAAGVDARRFFEAQLEGFRQAVDFDGAVRLTWIRELHVRICEPQETYEVDTPEGRQVLPLPKGSYKQFPNEVVRADGSKLTYAPVMTTGTEMDRLADQLNSVAFSSAHPILQASYAHFAFVRIHPFADGNGRVARALASAFIFRGVGVPLLIFLDQRQRYTNALLAADEGNQQRFVDFVLDRSADALRFLSDELKPRPGPEVQLLRTGLTSHGGFYHLQIDELVDVFLGLVETAFREQISALDPPKGIQMSAGRGSGGQAPAIPEGYRLPANVPRLRLSLNSSAPAEFHRSINFVPIIAKATPSRYPIVLHGLDTSERYEVQVEEINPTGTEALRAGLRFWAEGVLGVELRNFRATVEERLRASGFLPKDSPR